MIREGAASLVQVGMLVVGGPLLVGWMRKVRAFWEGRSGSPVHQVILDIVKHVRKERTRPHSSSWIYSLAPSAVFTSTVTVAAVIPVVAIRTAGSSTADLFAVVFVLLIGTVVMALGALDAGSSFGGMGSSRSMMIGALAEPALLVAILALSIPVHTSNLGAAVNGAIAHPLWLVTPQRLLAVGAFVLVVLAEAGRLPVDNPSTHLELTMIHEAMVLEYSGGDFALLILGSSMRLALLLGLMASLFVPWGIARTLSVPGMAVGVLAAVGKVALFGGVIATAEVAIAKVRLFRVPELMAGAFVLSVISVVIAMVAA